jgi:hypothetical protein
MPSHNTSKIGRLREALLALLAEHQRDDALPTSGRFLFYELIVRAIISKHPTGKRRADQDMTEALTQLRENGDVPWDWIVDETRSLEDYSGLASIVEGVLKRLAYIRLDPWKADVPLILCESRSLAGCLRPVASEYGVRIAPTNGQCGGFLHTDVAPTLKPWQRVLYLGDFDLCGNMIEDNTRRVLEREVGELEWERLALTEEQVTEYDLPRITKNDRRFKNGGGRHEAVETEALSQRLILDIVRARLDELLPESLETVQERAERERENLRNRLR